MTFYHGSSEISTAPESSKSEVDTGMYVPYLIFICSFIYLFGSVINIYWFIHIYKYKQISIHILIYTSDSLFLSALPHVSTRVRIDTLEFRQKTTTTG